MGFWHLLRGSMGMKTTRLASSMAEIAERCPFEPLTSESRYVIIADLRMGDGGKKDEAVIARKALFAVLGRWYLPRGYTLVLNGDIEDLRGFWLKDILAAWPQMYALFDAFAENGRLHKIVGDRDLGLLRLGSHPYKLTHGLRLTGETNSLLVLHGHQVSPPYAGRNYLSDYLQNWFGSAKGSKRENPDDGRRERVKMEKRLHRAARRLGVVAIQGHTGRPLFESLTNRDAARAEAELLLGVNDTPGVLSGDREGVSPWLFSPGRVVGARGLRFLELDGDSIRQVLWGRTEGRRTERRRPNPPDIASQVASPQFLEGTPFARFEARSAQLHDLFARVNLFNAGDQR